MSKKEIIIIVEFQLTFPYNKSAPIVIDMANLWKCKILAVGTRSGLARIGMPWSKFKLMFHKNPSIGKLDIPSGAEGFVEEVYVKEILV